MNDPGVLALDPTGRIAGNVLIYMLDPMHLVVNGDVRIWEDSAKTILSDVITFTNATGSLDGTLNADRMIYYSEPGDSDKADTGIPATLTPRDGGGIVEVGPEGSNGFTWEPGGPTGNVYNGISDVPEPASLGWRLTPFTKCDVQYIGCPLTLLSRDHGVRSRGGIYRAEG